MSAEKLKYEIAAAFEVVKDRSSAEEIVIICPVPGCGDKSGNRSINLKTGRSHCWRCQDNQPKHVASLFRSVGLEYTADLSLDANELQLQMAGTVRSVLTPVQDIKLPEGFTELSKDRKSCYWRFCKRMAERKRLGIEDLEEAGAGFTREGYWEPFCIFPCYEGDRTVYYQGRTYNDEGFETTKKFPSKKVVPFGPSYWVYNLDALKDPAVALVIIVESVLNVLSLRRRLRELGIEREIIPVCIFTHRISKAQIAKLQRYKHVKDFCILYDSDSSGLASQAGISVGTVLPVTVAHMPTGVNKDGSVRLTNDANDDVDAALGAVLKRDAPAEKDTFMQKMLAASSAKVGSFT
jgi:hypothetical protein